LPPFTFEWVKRGRGSIFGIGEDLLIGKGEVLRKYDHSMKGFIEVVRSGGQQCHETFMGSGEAFV
jgi:hypothetical protein